MDVRGEKLVGYLLLKEGLIEEITVFIIHYMEIGLVSRIFEYVKEFLDPFFDACA